MKLKQYLGPEDIQAGPERAMENPLKGLTSDEARRRLGQFGPNATPDVAIHPLRLVLSKFLAPVSVLLEIAIALQFALGEYVEASIIGALLVFNTAIGFFHESRAQATIAALKSRLALNASVLRAGNSLRLHEARHFHSSGYRFCNTNVSFSAATPASLAPSQKTN